MLDKTHEELLSLTDGIVEKSHKQFGVGTIIRLGGTDAINVEAIRTGVPQLDVAIGVGGLPRGRVVEFYGCESCGKTTLALQCIAHFQRQGLLAGIVDAEHALDPEWATKLGVDIDSLLLSQPDCGEEALEVALYMIQSGIKIVVVDSVAALVPKAELEGDMGEAHVGRQARLMGQALRKITAITKKAGTTVIFINQTRMKIGVLYGNPETTPGGLALKFYASLRLAISKLSPKDEDKEKENVISQTVKIKVVKNKVAPPFKLCECKMVFKEGFEGFDLSHNLFYGMLESGLLEKKGNTYSVDGEKLAVGKGATIKALQNMKIKVLNKYYDKLLLYMDKRYMKALQLLADTEEAMEEFDEDSQNCKAYKRLVSKQTKLKAEISKYKAAHTYGKA